MVLFGYALSDGASCNDGDGVVSRADIYKTYETGDGCLSPTTTIDTLGKFVD